MQFLNICFRESKARFRENHSLNYIVQSKKMSVHFCVRFFRMDVIKMTTGSIGFCFSGNILTVGVVFPIPSDTPPLNSHLGCQGIKSFTSPSI